MTTNLRSISFHRGGYCRQLARLAGLRSWTFPRFYALFVYFEHPKHGPSLIDTGYSRHVYHATRHFPQRFHHWLLPVRLHPKEDPPQILESAGCRRPIRRIFLSHWHSDHIGGMKCFPQCEFVYRRHSYEQLAAFSSVNQVRRGFLRDLIPDDFLARSEAVAEKRFVRGSGELHEFRVLDYWGDGSLQLVDLPGHAFQQTGFLLRGDEQRFFYVADAYWNLDVLLNGRRLPWLSRRIQDDFVAYESTQAKLNRLAPRTDWQLVACHCSEHCSMCKNLRIDFVSPPFAGHLFPCLQLAAGLRARGFENLQVLTSASGLPAVHAWGLNSLELLPGRDERVVAIADTRQRIGSNPFAMWRQIRQNLALMTELRDQLRSIWNQDRPDLVLADFVVPMAGLAAAEMGIGWWTGMATPCALETQTGTPSYLGGWRPLNNSMGRIRDRCGRCLVRGFKTATAWLFARELRALSIPRLYRPDGTEVIYSPQRILGYGMREFEFPRDWPSCFEFVGPLAQSPPLPHSAPTFHDGRKTVLVTMGTHLPWARERMHHLFREVAALLPDWDFHLSGGRPGHEGETTAENLHIYEYVPYDRYLDRYDLAVVHGGTGITYACIQAAVPMLVWPQDYDQFDHAARIVAHGLGRRLTPRSHTIAADLRELAGHGVVREQLQRFQEAARRYDPVTILLARLDAFAEEDVLVEEPGS